MKKSEVLEKIREKIEETKQEWPKNVWSLDDVDAGVLYGLDEAYQYAYGLVVLITEIDNEA